MMLLQCGDQCSVAAGHESNLFVAQGQVEEKVVIQVIQLKSDCCAGIPGITKIEPAMDVPWIALQLMDVGDKNRDQLMED